MLLPRAPQVKILLAMKEDGEAVDYADQAGIGDLVTHQFKRKHGPVRGDMPCHTMIFVGDGSVPGETGLTAHESVRQMTVDVQTDIELDTVESGADPTGLETLLRTQAAFFAALRDPTSRTMQCVDWVIMGDVEPEDRAQPEDGRVTRSLVLQYRVSSTDENVLLAAGENA